MFNANRRLEGKAALFKFAFGIRARLMVLAAIAILPLLFVRIHDIETERAESIEAASKKAVMLAHQGVASLNEAMVSIRAFMQVTANAHGLTTPGGERCNGFLAEAVRHVGWVKSLSLVEIGGRIVCSSNTAVVGDDISHLPHFKRAMQTGEFAISDYFVSRVVGPTLFSALPHRAPDGAIDVLVSAPLQLGRFTQVAGALAQSSRAFVMMVDGSGTLLASQPSRENWVGRQFTDHAMIRAVLASPQGVATGEGPDGVRRIFGFAELPGTGVRLAVGLDESDVLGGVSREILAGLAMLALMIAVIVIGVWFGGERLFVRPIQLLAKTAQRLGHGDYGARAMDLPLAAEFVPLAAALDDMAGRLASREQELRDSNGQLRELAYIDALTGIANRRAFNARLATEWQTAAGLVQPVAVLLIDVDHFKLYNDHYGHIRGDACLRKLSQVLSATTRVLEGAAAQAADAVVPPSLRKFVARDADFTARYGGEEFAVLLQGADLDRAMMVAERLREAVADLRMQHAMAPAGIVTISIGAASIVPTKGTNAQRLVEIADAGLYEAKRRGRNQVVAHSERMLSKAS